MAEKLKILFLSPEVVPFAKSGGLADVAGSLPKALKRLGVDIRIAMPYYRIIRESGFESRLIIKDLEVPLGRESLKTDIFKSSLGNTIPVYLIKREDMYDRPNLYGDSGSDYYDNLERFSFFSHSALRVALDIGFSPDIIHCHDWQTGIIPALLKGPYSGINGLSGTATIFTIHNMGYQGIFKKEKLPMTGLPERDFYHPGGLEYWGNISLLKAGIVYSDAITTVSPTYAKEIQTPEFGMGMEGILLQRSKSLHGILNGIDYNDWNPAKDNNISNRYSIRAMAGKSQCKRDLISEMGLDSSLIESPLLGIISRLDAQKGLDILLEILDELMGLNIGLVVLGSGDESVQEKIKKAAHRHKRRIGIETGFNNPLAHRIMAGSDIFLIPSMYEPCGLTQMYALKYGTVPVVRKTGGLNDTIESFDEKTGTGNGFKFGAYEAYALLKEIKRAVRIYQDKKVWKKIMAKGMAADYSWKKSAKAYMELYGLIMK